MSFRVPFTFNSLQTKVKKGINNKSWVRKQFLSTSTHKWWTLSTCRSKLESVWNKWQFLPSCLAGETHTGFGARPTWVPIWALPVPATILSEPQDLISKKGQRIICLVVLLWGPMSLAHDNHYKTRAIFIQSSLCEREEYGKGVTWAL